MELYKEEFVWQVNLYYDDRLKIESTLQENVDWAEALWEWCEETFGEQYERWVRDYRESYDCDLFCFLREEDRNWFVLRWS